MWWHSCGGETNGSVLAREPRLYEAEWHLWCVPKEGLQASGCYVAMAGIGLDTVLANTGDFGGIA